MSAHEPVAVIPALYDFLRWAMPKVAVFPRAHRFTVGDRLVSTLLDVLDALIEAKYVREVRSAIGPSIAVITAKRRRVGLILTRT